MKLFVDADYKCHLENDGTMTEVETDAFDGKCQALIEGYRYVPAGTVWVREDGVAFGGEMIAPWRDYASLAEAQRKFEFEQMRAELADAKAALAIFGVTEEVPANG